MSSPEESLARAAILRPFQRGDVVFIELGRVYSVEQMEGIARSFKSLLEATGIKVVLLEKGMKIVGKPTEENQT